MIIEIVSCNNIKHYLYMGIYSLASLSKNLKELEALMSLPRGIG